MTTNQNTNEEEVLDEEMDNLLKEVEAINNDIDETSKETSSEMKNIEEDVNKTIKGINEDIAVLEKNEENSETEMEELMMEEAEDLAKDDIKDEEN